VGSALAEIENSSSEWKAALRLVLLTSVRDMTKPINSRKPVYLVMIPIPCLKSYNKVSKKLIAELEKRIKATILITAKRSIESKWIKHHR
jgi:small subunit ribosomal protein S7e